MIGDTSFFIDLIRADPGAVETVRTYERRNLKIYLTTVTVFELRFGISRSAREDVEKAQIYTVLEGLPVYTFDQAAAIEAGKIYSKKSSTGKDMDVEDAMIAGIAVTRKENVLTRYRDVFSGIDGLVITEY